MARVRARAVLPNAFKKESACRASPLESTRGGLADDPIGAERMRQTTRRFNRQTRASAPFFFNLTRFYRERFGLTENDGSIFNGAPLF